MPHKFVREGFTHKCHHVNVSWLSAPQFKVVWRGPLVVHPQRFPCAIADEAIVVWTLSGGNARQL